MVRQKESGDLINIDEHLGVMRGALAGDSRILAAYIFGSYGTPDQTPLSDVDLAVLFEEGVKVSLDDELALSAALSSIAREDDLNLIILNKAPVDLQFKVISTGRPLFRRDSLRVADFVERVLKLYGDFGVDLAQFNRDYEARLREVYSK
ncbi:MAG: nucleotidyltransferase domain-containing protein [Actinobacteria bacterium]|nr:nucleotidyltransferase domain-containing protein [Actinomycetota bacterium]